MGPDRALLAAMQAERGYVLSYHVIYGFLEPTFLDAYAALYRAGNLVPRFLSERQRELIWIALLAAMQQKAGMIHLDRAVKAGVGADDFAATCRLAAIVPGWPTFVYTNDWQPWTQQDAESGYRALVEAARGTIEPELTDLILLNVHGYYQFADGFTYHLRRCVAANLPETWIAEAISYLLPPAGATALLWATDRWLDALRSGAIPPSPTFGTADFPTRDAGH